MVTSLLAAFLRWAEVAPANSADTVFAFVGATVIDGRGGLPMPGAVVAAKAGVIADVPAGATVFGTPAGPHREQMRSFAALRRLPDALRRLEQLERMVLPRSAEEDR